MAGVATRSPAPVPYRAYFQQVPSRMHNVSIVPTAVFTSHLVNQLVIGYNYFKQTFNAFDTSFDPAAAGLNTGVSDDPYLSGAPNITVSGFHRRRRQPAARPRRQDHPVHRTRCRTRPGHTS